MYLQLQNESLNEDIAPIDDSAFPSNDTAYRQLVREQVGAHNHLFLL